MPLINHPLNAISNSGNIYRLSYDPKKESEHILNLLKERLDTIYKREEVLLAVLPQGSYKYTFRTVTEPYLNQFQNQNHLNQFLERTVIPILQQLIAQIEKIGGVKVQTEYIETLNEALPILEQYVFQKNIESRKSLYSKIINLYPNYQSWNLSAISLHLLHSSLGKGVVLLGMRKEEYVKDATFSFAASETEIQYQDWKQFEV